MGPFAERLQIAEAAIVAGIDRLAAAKSDFGDLLLLSPELKSGRRASAEREIIHDEKALDEARALVASLIAMRPLVVLEEMRAGLLEAAAEDERLGAISAQANRVYADLLQKADAAAVVATLADKAATMANSRHNNRHRALEAFERDNAEMLERTRLRFEVKPEMEAVSA